MLWLAYHPCRLDRIVYRRIAESPRHEVHAASNRQSRIRREISRFDIPPLFFALHKRSRVCFYLCSILWLSIVRHSWMRSISTQISKLSIITAGVASIPFIAVGQAQAASRL